MGIGDMYWNNPVGKVGMFVGVNNNTGKMGVSIDPDINTDLSGLDELLNGNGTSEHPGLTLSNLETEADPQAIFDQYGNAGLSKLFAKIFSLTEATRDAAGKVNLDDKTKEVLKDKFIQMGLISKGMSGKADKLKWTLAGTWVGLSIIEGTALYFGGRALIRLGGKFLKSMAERQASKAVAAKAATVAAPVLIPLAKALEVIKNTWKSNPAFAKTVAQLYTEGDATIKQWVDLIIRNSNNEAKVLEMKDLIVAHITELEKGAAYAANLGKVVKGAVVAVGVVGGLTVGGIEVKAHIDRSRAALKDRTYTVTTADTQLEGKKLPAGAEITNVSNDKDKSNFSIAFKMPDGNQYTYTYNMKLAAGEKVWAAIQDPDDSARVKVTILSTFDNSERPYPFTVR